MRKLAHSILVFLSMLLAIALLVSYLSVYVDPNTFWIVGIVGLAYPILLLMNIASLIYWILRWKWEFIIPLIAILLGVTHFSSFFQFPFGKNSSVNESDIKVLTYNVNLFKLYFWAEKNPVQNEIFRFLKDEKPDIVCLQEFYVDSKKFSEQQARMKLNYNAHIGYIVKKKGSGYGLATFSRYPIADSGEIKFENSANSCIYTDLVIGSDTVRVYNNHLQSLRLKERNISFLLNQNFRKDAQKMDEIKDISFRYRDALIKRARQVDMVTRHILKSPYPVIVCGDFNDSPISYNYRKMRENLEDSFIEMGAGIGYTYRGIIPTFRIDYIFHSSVFNATSYSSTHVDFSDHYPVITTLRVK